MSRRPSRLVGNRDNNLGLHCARSNRNRHHSRLELDVVLACACGGARDMDLGRRLCDSGTRVVPEHKGHVVADVRGIELVVRGGDGHGTFADTSRPPAE